jgi:hypothetical protein
MEDRTGHLSRADLSPFAIGRWSRDTSTRLHYMSTLTCCSDTGEEAVHSVRLDFSETWETMCKVYVVGLGLSQRLQIWREMTCRWEERGGEPLVFSGAPCSTLPTRRATKKTAVKSKYHQNPSYWHHDCSTTT